MSDFAVTISNYKVFPVFVCIPFSQNRTVFYSTGFPALFCGTLSMNLYDEVTDILWINHMHCTYICAVAHKHVHFHLHVIFVWSINTRLNSIVIINNFLFIRLFLVSLFNIWRATANPAFWHGCWIIVQKQNWSLFLLSRNASGKNIKIINLTHS